MDIVFKKLTVVMQSNIDVRSLYVTEWSLKSTLQSTVMA